ncbi:DUF1097 domain-containing protein [Methylobacterium sp. J-026]|uniref:DUF1097 domain-containing protein n=1 Tax=Methylobacterium sp. J-026 TaxID=2836624 RepID=UPI001FBA968A|nr:DUF1097 domain-containing protein [Methylobacterium sp. J-026]MCJ2132723.1 DUF1097 domain-containing protein [Methylobacterium sp. J-026]
MPPTLALATSIAILGGLDTYITATVLPIPVWVTFIAWASFFACGGGVLGFVKSVASNWIGVAIASLCLLAITTAPGSPTLAAISVGLGSGIMILAASAGFLGYPPAIVFGFASLVGTTQATGHGVLDAGLTHPTLVAGFSMLIGALFGIVSEILAKALTERPGAAAPAR